MMLGVLIILLDSYIMLIFQANKSEKKKKIKNTKVAEFCGHKIRAGRDE